jgi:hypothetical protein
MDKRVADGHVADRHRHFVQGLSLVVELAQACEGFRREGGGQRFERGRAFALVAQQDQRVEQTVAEGSRRSACQLSAIVRPVPFSCPLRSAQAPGPGCGLRPV